MGQGTGGMSRMPPRRHWRRHGTDPLPTGAEALDEPFNAFPSWFLRIECDRCGKVQMVNQVHSPHAHLPIRAILDKMRHDGCGRQGRPGGADHRHRGRQQPAGAPDRAAGGVRLRPDASQEALR